MPAECYWHRGYGGRNKKLIARPDRQFMFRLAERLGKTVNEMLSQMDSRELTEWMVLENFEYWRQRVQRKHDESQRLLKTLFGKAISIGAVRNG